MVGLMREFSFKNLGLAGRLGNQLWQIAWTLGEADRNGGNGIVVPDWEYRPFFSVPDSLFATASDDSIDGGLEYYQELHYWQQINSYIWSIFQPSDRALNETLEYVGDKAESMKSHGCSVHYRLGDYLNHPNHFPVPTIKYYSSSMQKVLDEDPETIFYVFSDSIKQVMFNYKTDEFTSSLVDSGKVVFFKGTPRPVEVSDRVGEPSDYLDLFSMAMCKNHIIANSTFSWWGAFLSESRTGFYPSRWFGTDPAVRHIPWRRMIPSDWTKINVD